MPRPVSTDNVIVSLTEKFGSLPDRRSAVREARASIRTLREGLRTSQETLRVEKGELLAEKKRVLSRLGEINDALKNAPAKSEIATLEAEVAGNAVKMFQIGFNGDSYVLQDIEAVKAAGGTLVDPPAIKFSSGAINLLLDQGRMDEDSKNLLRLGAAATSWKVTSDQVALWESEVRSAS